MSEDDGQYSADQVFEECNERLDVMVNQLVAIAQKQDAQALGPVDFIRMRATFEKQVSPFMLPYLAASAVVRVVNAQLAESERES